MLSTAFPTMTAIALNIQWDHPIHLMAELLVIFFVVYIVFTKSYRPKPQPKLTHNEEEFLIADWEPEPLVPAVSHLPYGLEDWPERITLTDAAKPVAKFGDLVAVNLSAQGVLGYQHHPEVIETAIECTKTYGVGSCGPRGFYGSHLPHLDLEARFSKFLGMDGGVMLSADFQNAASAIPAFAKLGDYLIIDEACNFAIHVGAKLSRAEIRRFRHNDVADLRRNLDSLKDVFERQVKRVFVIIEGVYQYHGDIAPLDQILVLKKDFHFRLILDESYSLGVLGKTGRGVTEHFGIPARNVELIMSSLGTSLGSIGGIVAGSQIICNHLRLNATGYVFSCSSPPYISAACQKAIDLLEIGKELPLLRHNVKLARDILENGLNGLLETSSDPLSPYTHWRLHPDQSSVMSEDFDLLNRIVLRAREPSSSAAPAPSAARSKSRGKAAPPAEESVRPKRRGSRGARAATEQSVSEFSVSEFDAGEATLSDMVVTAPAGTPVVVSISQYTADELHIPPPSIKINIPALLDPNSLSHALNHFVECAREVLGGQAESNGKRSKRR